MTTTPAPSSSSPQNPALDRFFAALRRSPVVRSRDRAVAGVCRGMADRLGVAPAAVRVVAVIGALLGPVIVLYLAGWLLLPDDEGGIRLEKALRGGDASSIVLLVVAALAVLPDAGFHAHGGWILPVLAVAVVAYFLRGRTSRRGEQGQGHAGHAAWSQASTPQGSPAGPQDAPQQ